MSVGERRTVCILCAGVGSRMGRALGWVNKALLPIDERAIISWLIERFGGDARYVIGLGHRAGQVRGYLELAHPETEFVFVEVEPWRGAGSGPGRSLLCCREAIGERRAFYFAPCDALLGEGVDLERGGDWVGVSEVPEAESHKYCNFELEGDRVVGIADKRRVSGAGRRAFTGVMRIESTHTFWKGLAGGGLVEGESQVSNGLEALVRGGTLRAVAMDWTDLGDERAYRRELVRRAGFDFSKPGEALYIVNGRVIKLFEDEAAARGRAERAGLGPGVFPEMIEAPSGFVAYRYEAGRTLYHSIDRERLGRLLGWLEGALWRAADAGADGFEAACERFYREKTLARVRRLEELGGLGGQATRVGGVETARVETLLERVDWSMLRRGGEPVFFHGDLQFDNVLERPDGTFTLLDWRQDFAGDLRSGDLDYDLAKMIGGIRMNYARIKRGEVAHETIGDDARLTYPSCPDAAALEGDVLAYGVSRGRDPRRIRLIVGLIYLNMAALHGEPFRRVLRDAARVAIGQAIEGVGRAGGCAA